MSRRSVTFKDPVAMGNDPQEDPKRPPPPMPNENEQDMPAVEEAAANDPNPSNQDAAAAAGASSSFVSLFDKMKGDSDDDDEDDDDITLEETAEDREEMKSLFSLAKEGMRDEQSDEKFRVYVIPITKSGSRVQYCARIDDGTRPEPMLNRPIFPNQDDVTRNWDQAEMAVRKLKYRPRPNNKKSLVTLTNDTALSDNNWEQVEAASNQLAWKYSAEAVAAQENRKYKIVRRMRKLPKLLDIDRFKEEYNDPFLKRIKKKWEGKQHEATLLQHFRVELDIWHPINDRLVGYGPRFALDEFESFFEIKFNREIMRKSMEHLVRDPERYEFDMAIPCEILLQEWAEQKESIFLDLNITKDPNCYNGLFIDWRKMEKSSIKKKETTTKAGLFEVFQQVLGTSALETKGLVVLITRMHHIELRSRWTWQQLKESLKGFDMAAPVMVTLVVSSWANLTDLDKSKLVGGIRRPGRFKEGEGVISSAVKQEEGLQSLQALSKKNKARQTAVGNSTDSKQEKSHKETVASKQEDNQSVQAAPKKKKAKLVVSGRTADSSHEIWHKETVAVKQEDPQVVTKMFADPSRGGGNSHDQARLQQLHSNKESLEEETEELVDSNLMEKAPQAAVGMECVQEEFEEEPKGSSPEPQERYNTEPQEDEAEEPVDAEQIESRLEPQGIYNTENQEEERGECADAKQTENRLLEAPGQYYMKTRQEETEERVGNFAESQAETGQNVPVDEAAWPTGAVGEENASASEAPAMGVKEDDLGSNGDSSAPVVKWEDQAKEEGLGSNGDASAPIKSEGQMKEEDLGGDADARVPIKSEAYTEEQLPGEIFLENDGESVVSALESVIVPQLTDPDVNRAQVARASKEAYQEFTKKFGGVYKIEYQRSDIGYHFVMSRMWKVHKREFGSQTCDEDCPCASVLYTLTDTIVCEYIAEQFKANENWSPRGRLAEWKSPVGFVTTFARRFLPRLKEKFPDETSLQIFNRLLKMWDLHVRQVAFGITCDDNCMCDAGWKEVCFEGNTDSATNYGKKNRKRSLPGRSQDPDVPLIRKKANSAKHSGLQEDSSVSPTLSSNLADYCVSYDVSHPLGFYCITKEHEGKTVCLIISINPMGQTKKEKLVQEGTVVISAEVTQYGQSTRHALKGHDDLKRCMEIQQANNRSEGMSTELKLWFRNVMVKKANNDRAMGSNLLPPVTADWSGVGKWRGATRTGWAGGAEIVFYHGSQTSDGDPNGKKSASASIASPRAARSVTSRTEAVPAATSWPVASINVESKEQLTWVQVTQKKKPLHRDYIPDFPILIRRIPKSLRRPPSNRRVQWEKSFDERIFDKAIPSVNWLAPKSDSSPSTARKDLSAIDFRTSSTLDAKDAETMSLKAIVKAVRANDMDQLLAELKSGRVSTESTIDDNHGQQNWLSREYRFTKERQLEDIGKVLNIYRTARTALASAVSLKCWNKYVVTLEKIIGITSEFTGNPRLSRHPSLECAVYYEVMGATQQLACVPLENVSEYGVVDFSDRELPEFPIHNNQSMPEKRILSIVLQSTADKSAFASLQLHIDEIGFQCYELGKSLTLNRKFQVGGAYQQTLSAITRVQKVPLEKDYLAAKQERGAKEISNVLEWIERFNAEKRKFSSIKLNANIHGSGGFSLLHAAIGEHGVDGLLVILFHCKSQVLIVPFVVFENLDLVKQLLLLGGDATAKGAEVGSAHSYAMSMAEHRREKLELEIERERAQDKLVRDGEAKPNSSLEENRKAMIQQLQFQFDRMHRISHIIQSYLHSPEMLQPADIRSIRSTQQLPSENSARESRPFVHLQRIQSASHATAPQAPEQRSKRKIDSQVDPHPKRQATPILVNGVCGAHVSGRSDPTLARAPVVEVHRAPPDSVPAEVLGGVSRVLVNKVLSSRNETETLDPYLLRVLESTWTAETAWKPNIEIARLFFKKIKGDKNRSIFKEARSRAGMRGFLKWGRRNLQTDAIEETLKGQKNGYSLETYLMLTALGLRVLLSHGFDESKELAFRRELPASPDQPRSQRAHDSPDQSRRLAAPNHERSVAHPGELRNQDRRQHSRPSENMGMFLDCIASCERNGWGSIASVAEQFSRLAGLDPELLFRDLVFEATKNQLVIWQDRRDHDRVLRDSQQWRRFPGARIRLDRNGHVPTEEIIGRPSGRSWGQQEDSHNWKSGHGDIGNRNGRNSQEQERRSPRHGFSEGALPFLPDGRFWCAGEGTCRNFLECDCPRSHLCPLLDPVLISPAEYEILRHDKVIYYEANEWFTAAYFDRRRGIYFQSQGGITGRLSSQGLHWYPSKTLAKRALQQVVAAFKRTHRPLPPPVVVHRKCS